MRGGSGEEGPAGSGEQRLLWGDGRGRGPAGRGEAGLAFPPRGLMAGGGPARQEGVSGDPAHPLDWEV